MKKTLIALSIFTVTTSFAATQGTLNLQGVVTPEVALVVTPNGTANTSLDLTSSAETNVASVNEKSNTLNGYKITVSSANDGKLVNQSDNSAVIDYQVNYGGAGLATISTAGVEVKNVAASGVVDTDSAVNVKFTGEQNIERLEGSYEDVLTFTISAN